tara:strand:- start:18397 stop:19164 length:768 start_codon:yes stop_codon:yes gene_type:complete
MNKKFTYEKNENMNIVDVTAIGDIEKKPGSKSIGEIIKENLKKLNEISPIKIKALSDESEPISIIHNNYEEVLDVSKFNEKKDFISPNPEDTTEFRFVDENMKTAWSNVNVSQHPKYYTSDIEDEKIDIGGFFNKDKFFHDNTSPDSTTTLPERCKQNKFGEVFCDYNNRLQLIPPKLIEDTESNPVLNSIGSNKVYQNIDNTKLKVINGLPLQVWEYENEKSINGGKYFGNVYGSSTSNENFMEIKDIKSNYSF